MNFLGIGAIVGATLVVLMPLFLIMGTVIYRGIGSITWAFFTRIPQPVGETGGGMANAIVGTAMIMGVAALIGIPLGVGSGIYLAEYGRNASGIITSIMLACARVAGETAPLLFTAFGNQFWNLKLNQPTAALPLQIFAYAISPYEEWHRMAWAGALVLILSIMATVILVRFATSRGMLKGAH